MRLLLDTHIFLWWRADAPELAASTREAVMDSSNEVFVSAAVAWEMVIKRSLGKLDFEGAVRDAVRDEGFESLPVRLVHVDELARLPHHHRDPFDRLLLAQARAESMTLVTADAAMRRYEGVHFL